MKLVAAEDKARFRLALQNAGSVADCGILIKSAY